MAEASEADHTNVLPRLINAIVFHRGVNSDACTKKGSTGLHIERLRIFEDKFAGSNNKGRVATLSWGACVVNAVVSENALGAELFSVSFALAASSTRSYHATNRTTLACCHVSDVGANFNNFTNNLVARHHRESGITPLALDLMIIRVANSTGDNLDLDIFRTNCKKLKARSILSILLCL
jgi:hypothetical protein